MNKVVIVGAGAWGTALALQAVRAGHSVALVARDASTAAAIRRDKENPRLPGCHIPDALDLRHDLPNDPDLLLWVVPTQQLRASLLRLTPQVGSIVICAKGVEVGTHMLPLEVAENVSWSQALAILTGPNFAHEVARGLPAAAVVASLDARLRKQVCSMLGTNTFRLYAHDDPIAAQLGGAAKNVIAIAAGAVAGMGLGENARAALVTRGLSEVCRLALALGGRAETVMGLSGLGDLLLTCSETSRNFSLGFALGQGDRLPDILRRASGVTEGVLTAPSLIARAAGVELPICSAVADLLAGTTTLNQAIIQLLSRPQRDE